MYSVRFTSIVTLQDSPLLDSSLPTPTPYLGEPPQAARSPEELPNITESTIDYIIIVTDE